MIRALSGAVLIGAALSGCGAPEEPAVRIGMDAVRFLPAEVEIKAGQTVEWINDSDRDHDVAGRGGTAFDSGQMVKGERFRRRFDQAGSFPYICSLHVNQGMTGVIRVTAR